MYRPPVFSMASHDSSDAIFTRAESLLKVSPFDTITSRLGFSAWLGRGERVNSSIGIGLLLKDKIFPLDELDRALPTQAKLPENKPNQQEMQRLQ